MASPSRPKQGVSIQTYYWGKGLEVRLEYHHKEEKQSVFLNSRLMSSFICASGKIGLHTFRSDDAKVADTGHLGDYKVRFAVEPTTMQIRFEISRRNAGGSDTDWYWYDRNIEPDEWEKLGHNDEDADDAGGPAVCNTCGEILGCPQCSQDDFQPKRLVTFDAVKIVEQLRCLDSDVLKSALVDEIEYDIGELTPWPVVMMQVLDEAGCETSSMSSQLDDASQNGE